jgi:hypothetical protein
MRTRSKPSPPGYEDGVRGGRATAAREGSGARIGPGAFELILERFETSELSNPR